MKQREPNILTLWKTMLNKMPDFVWKLVNNVNVYKINTK